MEKPLALEMKNITKRFPSVVANKDVSFQLKKGEVHALLGENGAGKTTLMNILYGIYHPDEGEVFVDGKKVLFSSPKDAIAQGIGMVHQHFMLVPTLTVVENVILGTNLSPYKIDITSAREKIIKLCEHYKFQLDVDRKIADLSVGSQQRVELIKALYRGSDILILDEPTAVLTPLEVEELFITLRKLVEGGKSVIFISHKLWEVIQISDRVTILKGGQVVETCNIGDVTREDLATKMVGREIITEYDKKPIVSNEPSIVLDKLCATGNSVASTLKDISFTVSKGEILGIAGVDGNGQRELAQAIMGLLKADSGSIAMNGSNITEWETRERINAGIVSIPEDRLKDALVLDFTLSENMVLDDYYKSPYTENGIFNQKAVDKNGDTLVKEFDVRPPIASAFAKKLSGGNQQKVVLARALSKQPTVILAAQPTRGLDVGASEFVYQRLIEEKEKGTGVILISADLDEILLVCDRALVMYEGKIMGEFIPGQIDFKDIGLMMGGTVLGKGGKANVV